MTKASRLLFWIPLVSLIGFTVLLNAPSIFGPIYDYYREKSFLDKSLESCRPDEMRFVVYYGKSGKKGATLNFETKTLDGGDSNPLVKWSWTGRLESVFSNVRLGFGQAPFTDEQINKIKSILAALPPSNATGLTGLVSYRDQFHLAFYKTGQLALGPTRNSAP